MTTSVLTRIFQLRTLKKWYIIAKNPDWSLCYEKRKTYHRTDQFLRNF